MLSFQDGKIGDAWWPNILFFLKVCGFEGKGSSFLY